MQRSVTAVPLLVGLALTIGMLGLVGLMSVMPWKTQILRGVGDYVPPAWEYHLSPVLVENGVRIRGETHCRTGSGFSPLCTWVDLPGNNQPNATGESSISQQVTLPDDASHYEFNLVSHGLSGMAGVGNSFNLVLCSSPSQECEGMPEQALRFELFRCLPGDGRCIATDKGGEAEYRARLVLSTHGGQTRMLAETGVENLTAVMVSWITVKLYDDAEAVEGQRLMGANVHADFRVAYVTQPGYNVPVEYFQHSIALENVTYDISKLDVVKIGFASACANCNSTYQGSFVNIGWSTYTLTAPMSSFLHLRTPAGAVLLTLVTIAPIVAAAVYVSKKRRTMQPNRKKLNAEHVDPFQCSSKVRNSKTSFSST